MRILVSGGEGNFAKQLKSKNSEHTIFYLSKGDMDITSPISIEYAINALKPDIFLHTAALSRPMIVHDENPEKSISLNIIGTSNCVNACIKAGVKIVYISTDYVYPGEVGNYKETDGVNPINKYAWSKLGGECACMMYDNSLILRMAMTQKPFPHPKAFVDVYKSSIWWDDAAEMVLRLIEKDATGIYNVGGERKSIYDFVKSENSCILEEHRDNINESTPSDVSMDITKLNDKLI